MRFLQNLSIQRKLVLIIMLTSGVTLLLASVAFAIKDIIIFRHSLVASLSSMTQMIGMNSEGTLLFNDPCTAKENLGTLRGMPYVYAACIYDREGKVFATYVRNDITYDISLLEYRESGHYFKKFEGDDYLFLFQPILSDNEVIGTVFVKYDLEEMLSKMKEAGFIFAIIMLLAVLVALKLSSSLQRLISDPILKLTDTVKTVSKRKDYSVREICKCPRDEIGVLIDGFNEMLAEIEIQEEQLKRHRENEIRQHQQYLHN
ncbi:CHASE sensor domain-containing protein [Desulfobacterales bacterium HSG2]|nr:CHASE sensor domain-containing protein [Desulfobacterales bacterium HSG2]